MKKYVLLLLFAPFSAFAQGAVPDGDPLQMLLNLVTNFKTLGPLGAGILFVTILTQVLKKYFPNFEYYRLAVTALAVIYSVLVSLTQGLSFVNALVMALITGGGAVALYEAAKGTGVVKTAAK